MCGAECATVRGGLTVRPIRREDHAEVGRMIVRAYDAAGSIDDEYREWLATPAAWVDGVSDVFVCVGEAAGVVGAVAFTRPGDAEFEHLEPPVADCGFRFLAVAPEAQGRGAGTALVRRCLQAARDHSCRRMVIHSMDFMTRAHRLYERLGFERRPDLDVRFPTGTGYAFAVDLTADAADHFPEPTPASGEPPWYEDVFVA